MNISPIQLKIVPFAVAVMLGGMSTGAMANPVAYGPNITLDANYSLGGGVVQDGMADPSANIYPPSSATNGADFYLYKSDDSGNNVFFHTYGFTSSPTYFGARASGEGTFTANTRATFSQTFENTSGVAQIYNFSFMVDQGEIGVFGLGTGFASLLLNIKKDGVSVARDFTSIDQTTTGTLCSKTDSNNVGSFGLAYMTCADAGVSGASASGGLFNVSLGSIASGQGFTLDYDIIATVSGELSAGSGTVYQACYGGGGFEVGEDGDQIAARNADTDKAICSFESFFPGSAIARSGDPFNGPEFGSGGPSALNVSAFAVTSSPANGVPEPGSMALMGLALAGLAATRRKKA